MGFTLDPPMVIYIVLSTTALTHTSQHASYKLITDMIPCLIAK